MDAKDRQITSLLQVKSDHERRLEYIHEESDNKLVELEEYVRQAISERDGAKAAKTEADR